MALRCTLLQELQLQFDDAQRVATSETKFASQVQALEDAMEEVIEVTSETNAIVGPWMDERLVSATMRQRALSKSCHWSHFG